MKSKEQGASPKSLRKIISTFCSAAILLAGFAVFGAGCGGKDSADENTADPRLVKAKEFIKSEKYSMAQYNLEELLKENPQNLDAMTTLAQIKLAINQADEASEWALKALEVDPNSAEAHLVISSLYYLRGRFAKSLEHARKAVHGNPLLPKPYYVIGELYLRSGRHEDGLKALQHAATLDPKDAAIQNLMSSSYLKLGRHEKALEHAKNALDIDPNWPGAHFNIATAYYHSRNAQKALDHARLALKLYKEQGKPQWTLKSKQLVDLITKKFKMRPKDVAG